MFNQDMTREDNTLQTNTNKKIVFVLDLLIHYNIIMK